MTTIPTRYSSKRKASGGQVLALLAVIPLSIVFHGWALKTAWNWFVPAITSWPRLGIAQAIGFSIVLTVARPRTSKSDGADDDLAKFWTLVVTHVFTILLTLGIGWIVHGVIV